MANIWFSSDWHRGHKNIVRGETEWQDLSQCRDFATLKDHDRRIIDNVNAHVKQEDILYFMGDWSMGGDEMVWKTRREINCDTIHFVGGNHDHFIRRNKILTTDRGLVNARNLFTSYQEILEKEIRNQCIVMCHYAFRTWHKASRGSWMLHGHSHGSLREYGREGSPDLYKQIDVGIDTHPEFRPYHYDEIQAIMNNRINLAHHAPRE